MTYAETFSIALRSSDTGLTLKAALRGTDGTIDATLRDISTGFSEHGAGQYQWRYASFADGFNGTVVFYVGTLGAASDFSGVTVKASGVAGLVEKVANAVSSSAVVVLPSSATAQDRVKGTTITAFTEELLVVPLVVRDADCTAVDLSAKTLVFVVTQEDGTLVDSIPDADISISGDDSNTATFTVTSDMVATAGSYKWALRVATTNAVLAHGDFVVRFAANA